MDAPLNWLGCMSVWSTGFVFLSKLPHNFIRISFVVSNVAIHLPLITRKAAPEMVRFFFLFNFNKMRNWG